MDLLTVAGHKLYAPKGVGALFVRRGLRLEPLIHGAGHEGGRRAGTENVASIVGLGEACRLALAGAGLAEEASRLHTLRDRLHAGLAAQAGPVRLNGHPSDRLPNTLNLSFAGIEGNAPARGDAGNRCFHRLRLPCRAHGAIGSPAGDGYIA